GRPPCGVTRQAVVLRLEFEFERQSCVRDLSPAEQRVPGRLAARTWCWRHRPPNDDRRRHITYPVVFLGWSIGQPVVAGIGPTGERRRARRREPTSRAGYTTRLH